MDCLSFLLPRGPASLENSYAIRWVTACVSDEDNLKTSKPKFRKSALIFLEGRFLFGESNFIPGINPFGKNAFMVLLALFISFSLSWEKEAAILASG